MRHLLAGMLAALCACWPALALAQGMGQSGQRGIGTSGVTSAMILDESILSSDILNGEVSALDLGSDVVGITHIDNTLTLSSTTLGASECYYGTTGVIFEGTADDTVQGLLTWPTITSSDKTLTLPDATGTVLASTTLSVSSTGAVTGLLSGTGADNQTTLPFDIGVTGADAGAHSITLGIDGTTALIVTATGNGAGGIGAIETQLTGGRLNAATNIISNIGNAGTDFIASTGGLTLAGILTGNGGALVVQPATDAIGLTVRGIATSAANIFLVEDSGGNDLVSTSGADGTTTFVAGAVTSNVNLTFAGTAHLRHTGTAPALSSCGTTPSIVGTDLAGKITFGTGGPTACTATFAAAYAAAPACVLTCDQTGVVYRATTSTTALSITTSADASSDVCMYLCAEGS